MKLANIIKDQIKSYKIDLNAVALLTNLSKERLEQIEQGDKVSDKELKAICLGLNLDYFWLKQQLKINSHSSDKKLDVVKYNLQSSFGMLIEQELVKLNIPLEALAIISKIDLEELISIKNGAQPSLKTLKSLTMFFGWNYIEIMSLLKSEQFSRMPHTNYFYADYTKEEAYKLLAEINRKIKTYNKDLKQLIAQLTLINDYLN